MTNVVVAAVDSIVRVGLESIVRSSPELALVGSSSNLATLTAVVATYAPDVVLIELGLDDELGSEKLVALGSLSQVAIALLTDNLDIDWLTEALRLGVKAILPRSSTAEEIVVAVVTAAAGLVVLQPDVVDLLLSILPTTGRSLDVAAPIQALTPREIEVLGMLAEGLGNKAIARRLNISEHTVKFHISSIFTKLNASSRTEAVTIGARQGLIML